MDMGKDASSYPGIKPVLIATYLRPLLDGLEEAVSQATKYRKMPHGAKKHLKRVNAPSSWMLDKMGGIYAPKPSAGPHKSRESIPIFLVLRNKLKYALDRREVRFITANRNVLVDGKVRTDMKFPTGFMDVVSIPKTKDSFRVLYDVKGRFFLQPIAEEEAKFKLCKVLTVAAGLKKIPYVTTHDGRVIRYPDPLIRAGDTIKLDLATGKIVDFVKLDLGKLCFVNKGQNTGRIGVLIHRERHMGSFDIAKLRDAKGNVFAVRLDACFVIGEGEGKSRVALPRRNGVKLSIIEEKAQKLSA